MGHDPLTLQVFNADADARMVWAVHRDDPTKLVYVGDDEVDAAYRAWTKERLACVVPGCTVPLTAAHRSTKRDGFVHQGPVDPATHNPESILHQQGKAAILAWVRHAYPEVVIDPEVDLEGGQRRPDVLAVSPSGNRIAFEVQYSGLSVEAWRARHDWYAAHDVTDVWLFGHTGVHFLRTGGWGDADVKLNAVQQAVLDAGLPVWWINPVDATVAWAGTYTTVPGQARRTVLVPGRDSYVRITICPLVQGRLAKDGLRSDLYTKALGDQARVAEAARLAAERERQRAEASHRATERHASSQQDRLTRAIVRRTVAPISDVDTLAALWERSSTRERGVELFGDDFERLVLVPYPEIPSPYVGIDHRHWQTAAYLYALHNGTELKNPARVWIKENDFAEGIDFLEMPYHAEALRRLVNDWSRVLRDRGVLRTSRIRVTRYRHQGGTTALSRASAPGGEGPSAQGPAERAFAEQPAPAEPVPGPPPAPAPPVPATKESPMVRRARVVAAASNARRTGNAPVPRAVDPATVPDGYCLGCRAKLTDADLAAGSRRHLGRWGCAGPL